MAEVTHLSTFADRFYREPDADRDLSPEREIAAAMAERNDELRAAIERAISEDTSTAEEDDEVRKLGMWPHLMRSWEVILRAALARTDPLRGGA